MPAMSPSCIKKIFFLCLIVAGIFPVTTHAQIDQRCWLEQECYDARAALFGGEKPKIGEVGWDKVFRQDNTTKKLCGGDKDALNKKIGFCLPATTAKTKISIGGQTEFTGLTEFVSFIYTYGLSVASLLAILVIIVAGVQWTLSGGNTEAISGAQHKIYGAVIGLVILAAAYTILYTVNPDLVNLRPPNAWMINTQTIGAPYCSDITDSMISKDPSNATGEILTSEEKQAGFALVSATDWVSTSTAACGNDYYVQKTGALTCSGDYCPRTDDNKTQVCFDKNRDGRKECAEASIAGTIYNRDLGAEIFIQLGGLARMFAGEGWTWIWVEDFDVYVVCNNGKHSTIEAQASNPEDSLNESKKEQQYWISIEDKTLDAATKYCEDKGLVKGIALGPDMNESGDIFGARERHIVGRHPGFNAEGGAGRSVAADLGDESNSDDECLLKLVPANYLISIEDLKKNGVLLDINAQLIFDIDDERDRIKHYDKPFGYSQHCLNR